MKLNKKEKKKEKNNERILSFYDDDNDDNDDNDDDFIWACIPNKYIDFFIHQLICSSSIYN